jgi:hypothetical protein
LFGYTTDVIMSFFVTETTESKGWLTSSPVFLGEVDRKLVDHVARISGKCAEETAVPVHDDKTESGVVFEELVEGLGVEFVVAEVQGGIDRFEGFEIDVEFALFAFVCDDVSVDHVSWQVQLLCDLFGLADLPGGEVLDVPTEDDKPVGRYFIVEFEPLLGWGDCSQDGESVDAWLDVWRCAVFFGQKLLDTGDLVFGWDDEGDHACPVAPCHFKALDELLDLPDGDVLVCERFGVHDEQRNADAEKRKRNGKRKESEAWECLKCEAEVTLKGTGWRKKIMTRKEILFSNCKNSRDLLQQIFTQISKVAISSSKISGPHARRLRPELMEFSKSLIVL